jgi:hypothetical protein
MSGASSSLDEDALDSLSLSSRTRCRGLVPSGGVGEAERLRSLEARGRTTVAAASC